MLKVSGKRVQVQVQVQGSAALRWVRGPSWPQEPNSNRTLSSSWNSKPSVLFHFRGLRGSRRSCDLDLTQVVGPAVPGLVLVGEPGVEGRRTVVVKCVFNVFGHVFSSAVTAPGTDDQCRWKKAHRRGGLARGFMRHLKGLLGMYHTHSPLTQHSTAKHVDLHGRMPTESKT